MERKRQLFSDPRAPIESTPYRVLAAAGISPESSIEQILDASLNLLDDGMTPELHVALNELRLIERRLGIDFFLYDLEVGARGSESAARALPPLPVGWLESLAYPLPEEPVQVPKVAEPPPFLGAAPSPFPSADHRGASEHG